MDVLDVVQELAKHPSGTFLNLLKFNDAQFGACDVTGVSPVWEMHPDTDEFFYILEGQFEITLLQDDGPESFNAGPGSTFVVPAGIWHRPGAPAGCKFIHFTPGKSLHSEAEDPRNTSA
ncbi:MAG: cupin domain-containing protein [Pseudomonadota bacterium]